MHIAAGRHSHFLRWLIPPAIGILLLPIPLLGDFHFESAILAALIGSFWAGWQLSQRSESNTGDLERSLNIALMVVSAGLPLLIAALIQGCFTADALGFWIFYPLPSVLFGAALGRLIRFFGLPRPGVMTVAALLLIAIGGWIISFYSLPQVTFFNHVWGGWPGPIYDEEVRFTGSILFFRSLTLGWALLLWMIPSVDRDTLSKALTAGAALWLMFGYANLADFGIITPRSTLQTELSHRMESEHLIIYSDSSVFTPFERRKLLLDHEFYLHTITHTLDLDMAAYRDQKIESYLYRHLWQKKRLVGAKFTSYVPVWLAQDQLHVARPQLGSLKHELVHVVAKQFGNRLLNASWSIGLVEGLAVAVAGVKSARFDADALVAAQQEWPDAEAVANTLSFWGFYGGRSTVGYTEMGSLVGYLLARYPVDYLKQAYRSGDLASAYPAPLDSLVAGWHRHLETVAVDSVAAEASARLFSRLSIFEQNCPHRVTGAYRHWDRYRFLTAEKRPEEAYQALEKAIEAAPGNKRYRAEWIVQSLQRGAADEVITWHNSSDLNNPVFALLVADAFMLKGNFGQAQRVLPTKSAVSEGWVAEALQARADSLQWHYRSRLRYKEELFAPDIFDVMTEANQALFLSKAVELEAFGRFRASIGRLSPHHFSDRYLPELLTWLDAAAVLGEFDWGYRWLAAWQERSLKTKPSQLLDEMERKFRFIQKRYGPKPHVKDY